MLKYFIDKYININVKNKRLIFNSIFSFIVMGLSYIVSFLLMPAYMSFFVDQKLLGLWFTALAVLSWVLNFDLGIGNGLRNNLVDALARNDKSQVQSYISSAYILVGLIVVTITGVGLFFFSFINWNNIFNISDEIIDSATLLKAVNIIFVGIMLQFFLRLISSILYAMQMAYLPNLLGFLSNIMLLIFILYFRGGSAEHNLITLAYANIITANVPILGVTIYVFVKKINYAFPNIKYYNKKNAKSILKLGGAFFIIQIMYLLITNTNEFLIGWVTKIENVVEYKVYNSLFSIISGVFLLTLVPVWSEVTEAHVKNDHAWIKKLYKRLLGLAFLCLLGIIGVNFFLQTVIDLWLKDKTILVNYLYAITFSISTIFFIWSSILSAITSGIGKLKYQTIYMTIGALLNFPLAFFMASVTNSWIGVIIANIISLLPFCIGQSLWLKNYFKKMSYV